MFDQACDGSRESGGRNFGGSAAGAGFVGAGIEGSAFGVGFDTESAGFGLSGSVTGY